MNYRACMGFTAHNTTQGPESFVSTQGSAKIPAEHYLMTRRRCREAHRHGKLDLRVVLPILGNGVLSALRLMKKKRPSKVVCRRW